MIDSIYNALNKTNQQPPDSNYKASDAIVQKLLFNEEGTRLAIILPGWHTHKFPATILAKRLVRKGWAVLLYDFHDQVLESDEIVVRESMEYIRDSVTYDINNLDQAHSYQEIQLIGVSLGTLVLAMVASKFQNFNSATLVIGGDYLSVITWYGMRTESIRKQFEKMHIGLHRLSKDWQELAPINYAKFFKDKKVKVVIAKHDKFVLTKSQEKLAKEITKFTDNAKIQKIPGGHVVVGIYFYLVGSPQ